MLNINDIKYERLPGSGRRSQVLQLVSSSSTLWLGPDHLLCVESSGYTESYRRYYFRDIQAIQLCPTQEHLVVAMLTVVILIVSVTLILAIGGNSGPMFALIATVSTLVMLIFYLSKGGDLPGSDPDGGAVGSIAGGVENEAGAADSGADRSADRGGAGRASGAGGGVGATGGVSAAGASGFLWTTATAGRRRDAAASGAGLAAVAVWPGAAIGNAGSNNANSAINSLGRSAARDAFHA